MLAEWREQAACKGQSDLFFPTFNESPQLFDKRVEECKDVCHQCPVRRDCREWALSSFDEGIDLVLGGLSYRERLAMLKRNNRLGRGK